MLGFRDFDKVVVASAAFYQQQQRGKRGDLQWKLEAFSNA